MANTTAAPAPAPAAATKKAPAPAKAAAPAATTPAAAQAKKPTTPKATTETPPKAETPVANGGAPAETDAAEESSTSKMLKDAMEQVEKLMKGAKETLGLLKTLQREHNKEVKQLSKRKKQPKRNADGAAPSGFMKPVPISAEMSSFLGLEPNVVLPRKEVSSRLSTYIKENNLQVETDKRKFKPDAKLSKLLGIPSGEVIDFFKMQTHMKGHFPKPAADATAAANGTQKK